MKNESRSYSYSKEKRHQYYLAAMSRPGYTEKRREYARRYYKANSERIKNEVRRWQDDNPEKIKEYNRVRKYKRRAIQTPLEQTCVYCGKKYVVLPGSHPSKYCSYECVRNIGRDRARSRYHSHKEEIMAQATNWRKNNRERYNLLSRLSRIRKKNA